MLVQDPSKGNQDVDAIFDQARQLGASEGPVNHFHPSAAQQPDSVIHNIIFWSNGFTVNDGPLRGLDDPENAPFLESIRKFECPKELEPADSRAPLRVILVRREGNCSGVGRTLVSGSFTGLASSESSITSASSSTLSSSVAPTVDYSLPTTSVQLRLGDGTRIVADFNFHHTVGDIRRVIDASRPREARTYQLQTVGFPPKQLTDVTQTIEQAGLAKSVVIQKF